MKTPEANKKDLVFAWMNKQIKANKTQNIALFDEDIRCTFTDNTIHIYKGIKTISDITGIAYTEKDWHGNKHCKTNNLIRELQYKNYTFFELVPKEEMEDEGK